VLAMYKASSCDCNLRNIDTVLFKKKKKEHFAIVVLQIFLFSTTYYRMSTLA